MKTVKEITIGGDGAKAGLYADPEYIMVSAKYPIAKIAEPLANGIDKGIDFIEGIIPWDQKAVASILKANIRRALTKAFSALLPGVEVASTEAIQIDESSAQA